MLHEANTQSVFERQEYFEREWLDIIDKTEIEIRHLLSALIARRAEVLASRFYSKMIADLVAAEFLSHKMVEERLLQSMQHWLISLFSHYEKDQLAAAVARQQYVGEVHSRIKLPLQLVSQGAKLFKHWIWRYLLEDEQLTQDVLMRAVVYVNDMIDQSVEIMSVAFMHNSNRSVRAEEAYRLFSLSQDLAVERERQRAALMEWGHQIMYALHRHPENKLPRLSHSEFGLWLVHKALFTFEGAGEVREIKAIAELVDTALLPQFGMELSSEQISVLLIDLDNKLSQIKFLMANMFERYMEVENGRDVLTRLFNRQFLPSVLSREIELAKRMERPFALIMIDIDRFKEVNDQYGHDAGDIALQQVAALIMNTVRAGDFVFRYGGEEIMVVLVDIDQTVAMKVSEDIRQRIERADILLNEGRVLKLTVSIGFSVYDGHPDYHFLITQADTAMYQAKNSGRNRCVAAT
jgi:diguanylate cyclase